MSIREQMAKSTAGIKGVTGERPSGSGTPMPRTGYDIGNQKASRLSMVGSQSLDATRADTPMVVRGQAGRAMPVDPFWKGAPSSVNHVNAPAGVPGPNTKIP